MPPCLAQYYEVRIKVKWSNPGNRVAPSPTPQCSSYWKGSLQVTLDSGHQLYFIYMLFDEGSIPKIVMGECI